MTVPLIYVIAGEISGDQLGGTLMAALKRRLDGAVAFAGVGGETMAAQGLQPLFPMSDLSVMGLTEVVAHLPRLLRRMDEVVADVGARRPDIVITIDAPDFSFRVARRLRHSLPGIKLVHYVAPTVWAWRPGRAAKIARFLDHLLALLPFEPPYFTSVGLPCSFVGHPLAEISASGDAERFRRMHGLAPGTVVLCLLSGSRHGEIQRLLPLFRMVAEQLATRVPHLFCIFPTVGTVREQLTEGLDGMKVPYAISEGENAKADAMAASRAALAASGTIALELGLAGVPAVICYRMSDLTARIARRLVRVRYASLVNLLLDREVQPEFLQNDAVPEKIVPALLPLLSEGPARGEQLKLIAGVRDLLRPTGNSPSDAAASVILSLLAGSD